MGLPEGRSMETWIDFNMFGHQFVTHLNPQLGKAGKILSISNAVDGHGVPVPHYGVVMNFVDWEISPKKLACLLKILSLSCMCGLMERRANKVQCFFQTLLVIR